MKKNKKHLFPISSIPHPLQRTLHRLHNFIIHLFASQEEEEDEVGKYDSNGNNDDLHLALFQSTSNREGNILNMTLETVRKSQVLYEEAFLGTWTTVIFPCLPTSQAHIHGNEVRPAGHGIQLLYFYTKVCLS